MEADESPALPGGGTQVAVYVQLLNEGTIVYRPTIATVVGPDVVRLEATHDYDPESEEWEFLPGSTVRVGWRTLSEGVHRVAAAQAS